MISMSSVGEFKNTFKGNFSVKGKTVVTNKITDTGKVEGNSWLDKTEITNEDILLHLQGKTSIGMAPITEEGKVNFGVIDIDEYKAGIEEYIKLIYTFDIPLVPFYSKSKGLHAYVFLSEPTDPSELVDLLINIRITIGLAKDTELFPKQRKVERGRYSSWINLPYFAADDRDNPRKLVKEDLTLAPFDEAIAICKSKKKTIKELTAMVNNLPLADAPPCVQTIYLRGKTDFRNEYLFNIATYYKTKNEDNFEQDVLDANDKLDNPIDADELERTVLASQRRRTYSYKCNQPPISLLCNKATCRGRSMGIQGETITSLSYEEFFQYETDPPYYEWVINGKSLKFFREADIINQSTFRELCFRHLHIMPNKLVDKRWTTIVNNALENIVVVESDKTSEMSQGSMLMRYIVEFFTASVLADNKMMIKMGRVFLDAVRGYYVYRGTDLLVYLREKKGYKAYSDVEIHTKLKDIGTIQEPYTIAAGQILKCYLTPCDQIDKMKVDVSDITISYMEGEKDDGNKY